MKITPNIRKIVGLTTILGATLKSANSGSPKLVTLQVQCNRALKVFHKKDPKEYYKITDDVFEMWKILTERYSTLLTLEESTTFLSMLCTLVPPSDYKAFLGVSPYKGIETLREGKLEELTKSVLDLDQRLNKLFGTTSYTLPIRKPKEVKVKRARDKSKKVKKELKNRVFDKGKKQRVKNSLKEMIAKAKENV